MKKNKGFTLIELLAIISILGIILVIAIPVISNVMDGASEKAFRNSILSIVKSANYNYEKRVIGGQNLGTIEVDFENELNLDYITINGNLPISGILTIYPDGTIKLYKVSNGKYYATSDNNGFVINKVSEEEDLEVAITDPSCFTMSNNTITGVDTYNPNCRNNVVIPKVIDGKEVKAIFIYGSGLEYSGFLIIPDSVMYIDMQSFYTNDNSGQKNIHLPKNLKYMNNAHFYYMHEERQNINGFIYQLNNDGTLNKSVLVKYVGNESEIEIPEGVKIILNNAFDNFDGKIVKIPDNITGLTYDFYQKIKTYKDSNGFILSVDNSVLLGYEGEATDITLPNVKYIGYGALSSKNLTSITIPNTVTFIGENAITGNPLTNITLPSSLKFIDRYAFGSNQLTSITIPSSVNFIGESAFSSNNLTSVTLPDFIDYIGHQAFNGNPITSAKIPNTIYFGRDVFDYYNFESKTDFVLSEDGTILFNYTGAGGDVVIPNGVKHINDRAFDYKSINSIVIPNTVISIGESAFSGNNLTSVVIPDSVTSIGNYAFGYNNLTSVTIGKSVTSIGEGAFSGNSITSVVIPDSVTTIRRDAFGYNKLTSVTIGKSVTSIGESAFSGNSITSLKLSNSVTSIGNFAFANNKISNLVMSNSVKYIGDFAFSSNLITSVDIPNTITSIGYDAFFDNKIPDQNGFVLSKNKNVLLSYIGDDSNIEIPNTVTFISMYSLAYKQFNSIIIPDSVTSIGNYAFSGNKLTSIVIPDSVTSIGNYAFDYNKLTSVTIGKSITSIGENAFSGNNLSSIVIPNSVTSIGRYAFSYNMLTSVELPNSLKVIGESTFSGNQLTNITIPHSVTSIKSNAFGDNQITNVDIPATLINLEEYAFGYNQSELTLNIYGKCDRFNFMFEYSRFDGNINCK